MYVSATVDSFEYDNWSKYWRMLETLLVMRRQRADNALDTAYPAVMGTEWDKSFVTMLELTGPREPALKRVEDILRTEARKAAEWEELQRAREARVQTPLEAMWAGQPAAQPAATAEAQSPSYSPDYSPSSPDYSPAHDTASGTQRGYQSTPSSISGWAHAPHGTWAVASPYTHSPSHPSTPRIHSPSESGGGHSPFTPGVYSPLDSGPLTPGVYSPLDIANRPPTPNEQGLGGEFSMRVESDGQHAQGANGPLDVANRPLTPHEQSLGGEFSMRVECDGAQALR